ncbi:DUF6283 family protein [Aerosakkonema sp. BLCC-F183]|uniref:DUF6283 family protein n=1 Tax=Aerosakkonema sp. BLCC-F183 TaxID=3342834 RepID=UPI0035B9DFF4
MTTLQQCKTCPWKKEAKCSDIPNYNRSLHEKLSDTIAESDGNLSRINDIKIKAMACHYSKDNDEQYCVGWLHNQLGVGNNIPLRLKMIGSSIKIVLDGEQKRSFDETFE